MPVPAWLLGGAALGVGYLLFGEKSAKAKTAPAPKSPLPAVPSASKVEVVTAPKGSGTLGTVSQSSIDDVTKTGAVHIETQATGAQVFRKPDGGLLTVIPDVTVTAGQASNSAFVATQRDPLNIRSKPDSNSSKVGTAPKDSALEITGKIVSGPGSKKGWAPVRKPGTSIVGFAAVDNLKDLDIDDTFKGP